MHKAITVACEVKYSRCGTAESYQESDSERGQGQQPRQLPKDLHPHVIVNATPAGTQSLFVNAFTHPRSLPRPAQKEFQFMDAVPSNNNNGFINANEYEMNMESFFSGVRPHGPKT